MNTDQNISRKRTSWTFMHRLGFSPRPLNLIKTALYGPRLWSLPDDAQSVVLFLL